MSKPCQICDSPARAEIDRYLREMTLTGATVRGLAKRFAVSEDGLQRHKDKHSIEAETSEAEDILETMRAATKKALSEIQAEESSKDSPSVQASISVQNSGGYQSRCKCCRYSGHEDLDLDLLTGKLSDSGYAEIVGCSHKSVARHRNHISKEIAVSSEAELIINADSLVDQLKEARTKALNLLDKATEVGDTRCYGSPSAYLAEIRQQIRLWAELESRLPTQPLTQVNIYQSPEWDKVGDILSRALSDFPQLKVKIASELLALAKGATS